jgi:heptaprenyl diphosphate synthase
VAPDHIKDFKTYREIMIERFKEFRFLKKDIRKLESYLEGFSNSLQGILKENVLNTLIAGGKRLRPALLLICSRNENYDIDYLLPAAAAVEIIHTASLIHDDIIDKSLLRRGRKTIHSIYDKDTAKFVGNYLFTQTFYLLNHYEDPKLLREMSQTAQNLVMGEFDQIKTKKDLDQSEGVYIEKINEKTSSLFKASCALGGMLSSSSFKDIENMRKFGGFLGIAFQINDDLIDIDTSRTLENTGKPMGNDIRQGNVTLPLIYALSRDGFRPEIESILGKDSISDADVLRIIEMIYSTDAIKLCREKFYYYIDQAKKTIGSIHGKDRRNGLQRICDYFKSEVDKDN